MQRFIAELQVFWANVVEPITGFDVIDIIIVAILVYNLLLLTRETRANQVLKGVGMAFIAYWLSDLLGFTAIKWILGYLMDAGAIVIVVVFQPEIRRALEKIGRRTKIDHAPDAETQVELDAMVEEVVRACVHLAKRKVGALIVMEHKTGLADIIETGTILDGRVSAALLENIFEPNTPLHDGAVVIRRTRIVAAGCFLPLTEEDTISKQLGTRHRAGLGVTENADCVTIIVSEETGVISIAKGGHLSRHLDGDALRRVLSEIYEPVSDNSLLSYVPVIRKWRAKK